MKNPDTTFDINVPDVALVIEGGGMRASYTAGVIVTLLERGINFGHVYGISAGSSHAVNYVSHDIPRTRASFVDLVRDPEFGGMRSMLRGDGYFNAHHLYEGVAEDLVGTGDLFEFDWDAFRTNPADVHIDAFDPATGETLRWSKADMPVMRDMMLRVRASSTMPIFMPPPTIDGRVLYDGGLGESWGIPLEAARADGFERFFIVRTQERAYRKKPLGGGMQAVFRAAFRKEPLVAERTIDRWHHYNDLCDEVERLERAGAACVFYPEVMPVSNKETDLAKLQDSYERGYAQAQREADGWERWLFG